MAKVLISGGTGLVGQRISTLLQAKGYEIHILSRSKTGREGGIHYFKWSIGEDVEGDEGTIDDKALDVDHIIHLAGASVADKRWTAKRKKEIHDSRILSTRLLKNRIIKENRKLRSIVCASAVGFYGDCGEKILSEDTGPGKGFLATTCEEWERASADLGNSTNIPLSIMRIGIVLSARGGALPKLSTPAKFGIGAYLGSGKQYYPWIHIDDLCEMIIYAMEHSLNKIYNASAPNPVANKTLSKTIAYVLKRPFIPAPAPEFVLKLIMGEMSEMLLNSQRTSATKIEAEGFEFKHPDLERALRDIFRRKI